MSRPTTLCHWSALEGGGITSLEPIRHLRPFSLGTIRLVRLSACSRGPEATAPPPPGPPRGGRGNQQRVVRSL